MLNNTLAIWTVASSIILPGGTDNGLIPTAQCPAGIAYATSPVDLYHDASVGTDYAQEWWNESPLAAQTGVDVLKTGNIPWGSWEDLEHVPNLVLVLPSIFGSYGSVIHILDSNDPTGCTIKNAFVISPDITLPNAEGHLVYLLGRAMGLETDQYAFSVMDPRWVDMNRLSSRTTEITQADVMRILDRIVM